MPSGVFMWVLHSVISLSKDVQATNGQDRPRGVTVFQVIWKSIVYHWLKEAIQYQQNILWNLKFRICNAAFLKDNLLTSTAP